MPVLRPLPPSGSVLCYGTHNKSVLPFYPAYPYFVRYRFHIYRLSIPLPLWHFLLRPPFVNILFVYFSYSFLVGHCPLVHNPPVYFHFPPSNLPPVHLPPTACPALKGYIISGCTAVDGSSAQYPRADFHSLSAGLSGQIKTKTLQYIPL